MTLKEMTNLIKTCATDRWTFSDEEKAQVIAALKAGQVMYEALLDVAAEDGIVCVEAIEAYETVFSE